MLKKIGSCLLVAFMTLSISFIQVHALNSDHFEYTIENNEAIINRYVGTETNIKIPESINGYKVTKISVDFSADKPSGDQYDINELYISKTIKNMGEPRNQWNLGYFTDLHIGKFVVDDENTNYASYDDCLYTKQLDILLRCANKKKINISSSTKTLQPGCFESNDVIETISLSQSVEDISNNYYNGPFNGCNSIKEINVEEGNSHFTSKDGVLFKDNTIMYYPVEKKGTDYSIPDNVKTIGYECFMNAHYLENVQIPEGVTSMQKYAFSYCDNLKTVVIPSTLKNFGSYVFYSDNNLTEIHLPSNISLSDYAFSHCSNLNIILNKGTVDLGDNALGFCKMIFYYDETNLTDDQINYLQNNLFTPCKKIIEVKDAITNIKVLSETCTNIDESTELKVNQLKEGNEYDVVSKSFDNFELYDIAFYKDEEKVEVDGTAIVRIPVKEGMDGNKCKVYYNDNGTYTDMNAVYKDGYMEFKTDHFSQYIVTDSELPTTALGDVNGDGEINFLDAIMVLRYDAEIIELEDNQLDATDVNGDGEVNFLDAIMILRYDAEIIDSF